METVVFDGGQPRGDVGYFDYAVPADQWSWSDGVYAIHGYAPREVPATTQVLLYHKHPDDRSRAAAVLEQAASEGGAFSCYHRIVDRRQKVRSVLSVGRGVTDRSGAVTRVEGYLVDLTSSLRSETEAEVQQALIKIAEHREVIDQAKGMVMLAYGCDQDAAFAILRECSQNVNVKLRDIAYRLVESVRPGCTPDLVADVLGGPALSGRDLTEESAG